MLTVGVVVNLATGAHWGRWGMGNGGGLCTAASEPRARGRDLSERACVIPGRVLTPGPLLLDWSWLSAVTH